MVRRDRNKFGRPSAVLGKMDWRYIALALGLTEREIDVGRWIFDCAREPEIGAALGISVHTVHAHIRNIYEKTHTRNRAEFLVRVFIVHLGSFGRVDERTGRITPPRSR